MKLLVTGSSGFVGRALVPRLRASGHSLVLPVRKPSGAPLAGTRPFQIGGIDRHTDWREMLQDVEAVIHLAARVHQEDSNSPSARGLYQETNLWGTDRLARQAAEAGVRRFVFLSTVKVNGEYTPPGLCFGANDPPAPADSYGQSKREAEQRLFELSTRHGLEVSVIRPPLVYGPGVKGNLLRLMNWIHRRWPLPFGDIQNQRTLCAVENLADLIETCLAHPSAANRVFLAGDSTSLSTPELIRQIARGLKTSPRLMHVPARSLKWVCRLAGRKELWTRIGESLQLDISPNSRLLGWTPPCSIEQGINAMTSDYLRHVAASSR